MLKFDVTGIGSTMLRLSVPYGERIEYTNYFDAKIGGTETNTLIALNKMGKKTGWISRFTKNDIGKRIVSEVVSHGVDVSEVIWTEEDRNEVYFVEFGGAPRRIEVIYDRSHSAISKIKFEEINLDYLFNTEIFHFTGIFSALSDNNLEVSKKLVKAAKKAGVKISFDTNYRSKLWSTEDCAKGLEPIMKEVDIVFMTKEDARDIFGIEGGPEEIVKASFEKFKPEVAVISLGGEGGVIYDGKKIYRSYGYEIKSVDRIGCGDAYSAGVLTGYLEGDLQKGTDLGQAMAAIKTTIAGDLFLSNREEVEKIAETQGKREVGR